MPAAALREDHLVLGRYRPLRPLGSGGSGSVWLVRDERSGRELALKAVALEGKAGARAEREMEAVTRLRHPRCPRAVALARDDRHVYVAYEYVPGKTLRQALRHGELPDADTVEAAAQVLEALAHAHAQGVVHRDVKPANVILRQGEGVSVWLLDFGLARLEEADTLTAAGDVPGTLAYVAPERLDGREATGAADVWSVGVMLWEALAGRHPFWAPSPVETARRISAGAPPLASARPDLPDALCALVDRMLAPDPRRRPAAKRLAAQLREAQVTKRRVAARASRADVLHRTAHAAAASAFAGGAAFLLPFYPRGGAVALGALAAAVALKSPRAGLGAALAVPVLPLGNVSLGLALAYVPLALAWLVLFTGDPRSGLLFVAGPLLAPVGALPLAPVLALRARGALRRGALAAAAGGTGLAVAALVGLPFPFTGQSPPLGLGIAGSERPGAVAWAFLSFFDGHPALALELAVLAGAAATARAAVVRGPWGIALWGSGLLAAGLLLPPLAGGDSIDALSLVPGVWAACAALAAVAGRASR